jgi:hypothetical protein
VADVLSEVAAERARQDAKWGKPADRGYADGTGGLVWRADGVVRRDAIQEIRRERADEAREVCDAAFNEGRPEWRLVLREEVAEAIAEDEPAKLRAELIQVAAVAVAWIEAIDAREVGNG